MEHVLDSTHRRFTSARIRDSLTAAQHGVSLLQKGLGRFARKRPRVLACAGIVSVVGVVGILVGFQLLRRR